VDISEIYGITAFQCKLNSVNQGNLYEWVAKFEGWISVDYAYLEWPLIAACMEVKEQLDQRIRENRRTTLVSINHGKKLHKNCLRPSRVHYILMRTRSFWTVRPNALKYRATA
jgi:hypothetical protein